MNTNIWNSKKIADKRQYNGIMAWGIENLQSVHYITHYTITGVLMENKTCS